MKPLSVIVQITIFFLVAPLSQSFSAPLPRKHTTFFQGHQIKSYLPSQSCLHSLLRDSDSDDETSSRQPPPTTSIEVTRRNSILQLGSSNALLWALTSRKAGAYPENEKDPAGGIIDSNRSDSKRVVLSTSTTNAPSSYNNLPANVDNSEIDNSMKALSNSNPICVNEDPEARRIRVFERVAPSVVYIDTFIQQRDAFSTNVMEVPLGTGSGFVWDDKGHIVTNYHVVRNGKSAQVAILTRVVEDNESSSASAGGGSVKSRSKKTSGKDSSVTDYTRSVYKARVVGSDPDKDIAVLKVDAPVFDLFPIEVGTSKNLKVGQSALAIGNPFGLDHTLTAGILSGMGREVRSPSGRPISNVIQTDAAINPGNSGGPLLDSSGKLIGMNTAIYSPSGGSAGIGFAIPVDTLSYIVDTLIRDGRIIRPVIGISYLESKQAKALGISKGVLVLDVPASSPAARAGMRGTKRTESGLIEIGDIIIKVEDHRIDTEADLFEALEDFKPGDRIKITVNRVDVAAPNTRELKLKEVVLVTELKGSSDAAPAKTIRVE